MKPPTLCALVLAIALLTLTSIPCSAVVYVKGDSPGPAFDGASWDTAYHTVQEGVDDADVADEEVWVAAGTYAERIILKAGVGLYGGFAGTETSRGERNWSSNVTILDGGAAGSVVTISAGADTATVLDGFTIQNGRPIGSGAGINCVSASPTITHNVITSNDASGNSQVSGSGGGINCVSASPTIMYNVITHNSARGSGGGIFCDQSSAPWIADNVITNNNTSNPGTGGSGIMCDHASNPAITNNTLIGDFGDPSCGTIACANGSSPAISNNIVAFCDSGIVAAAGCSPTLSHNCVYANPWFDYSGISAGTGDISADPQFARRALDDYHILPSSPCRNAGDNAASGLPSDDFDGQARIEGAAVDIGADESHGETHTQNVIRVKADSPANGPGDDWSNAWHTVTEAMSHASAGYEVWVAAGTYRENITLRDGVALYGGFDGSETARIDRDRATNVTTLDGRQSGSVVTVQSGARESTAIDGFTIRNGTGGGGAESMGGGIYCMTASVTISNNTVTGNATVGKGGGIYCQGLSAWILNNVISDNRCATYGGGGIYGQCSRMVITGNTISRNAVLNTPGAVQYGGGIRLITGRQVVSRNTITDNTVVAANCNGGGLHLWGGTALVSDNVISRNRALGSYYGRGGGLGWFSGSPIITGNTIEDNIASSTTSLQSGGGGIFWDVMNTSVTITGNIIRGNSTDYRGGGICCVQGGLIAQNNTITGNEAALGAGIYGSGSITGNAITGNHATQDGGGIWGGSTVAGNVIAGNEAERGGGIYPLSGTIILNTIVDNRATLDGGGIMCDGSVPRITNNIIAFNDSGVYSTNGAPTATRNCVYGNTRYDYMQVLPGTGSLSLDPLLADRPGGDYHLLAASPCIDTGDNAYAGYPDIDGQARTFGGYADIGADEFTGVPTVPMPAFSPDGGTYGSTTNVVVTCPTPGAVIHYSTDGGEPTDTGPVVTSGSAVAVSQSLTLKAKAWRTGWTTSETKSAVYIVQPARSIRVKHDAPGPAHDGTSWNAAYLTVLEGLDAAVPGDEVWVARGTYTERVTLRSGIALYGGFAGTEIARTERPVFPRAYPDPDETILDGNSEGSVITVGTGAAISTRIDGFTIAHGSAAYGAGVVCWEASPTITNNLFRSNFADLYGGVGGGVLVYHASPAIKSNRFIGNGAGTGGAVGVLFKSAPSIANNILAGNSAHSGGALSCDLSSTPPVSGNTISGNEALNGGAFYYRSSSPTFVNNIAAFNSSGVFASGTSTPVFRYNCVYGNDEYNYSGLTDPTGINGNMSVDPKLADAEYGNLHIQADSPCLNKGNNADAVTDAGDMDGQARIQPVGGKVDIGADESDGTNWGSGPYAVVRVSTGGNDANDGSSWAASMRTVQAAIERASGIGGEVWVKSGIYTELVDLRPYAYLYGGFAGTENSVAQRPGFQRPLTDPQESVLDGQGGGTVVSAQCGYLVSRLDGFTVRNGDTTNDGGGVYCANASTTLENNKITNNTSASYGGGIACLASHSRISNNRITGNQSLFGGGLYAGDSSRLVVAGNILAANAALSVGGAVYCRSGSQLTMTSNTVADNTAGHGGGVYSELSNCTISDNIFAFNSSGILKIADSGTMTLQNNDLWGNTAYDYNGVSAGPGDIAVDPLFANRPAGDYHLAQVSPCIDRGLSSALGLPLADMDAEQRIFNGIVDIGADEWRPLLADTWDAKRQANGVTVEVRGLIVTAVFGSLFYAEEPDRSCGTSVYKTSHGATVGMKVDITGNASTGANGEKFIIGSIVAPSGSGSVDPIALLNRDIGGGECHYDPATYSGQKGIKSAVGLNNIGLLVRTRGKVGSRGTGWFYIDDGSALRDNSGNVGVKVQATGLTIPATGALVEVTGISTCSKSVSDLYRLLRARTQADIVAVQ